MKIYVVLYSHKYGETVQTYKNEKDAKIKQEKVEASDSDEGEFDEDIDYIQVIESELE